MSTLTGRSTRTVIRAPSLRLRTVPRKKPNISDEHSQTDAITKSSSDPLAVHSRVENQSRCKKCVKYTLVVSFMILLCSTLLFAHTLYLARMPAACSRISPDVDAIQRDLGHKVFGQHIAVSTILTALRQFYDPSNMAATLVFSFHGWTGVGKNFVSGLLADAIMVSDNGANVMKIIIPLHFPHENEGEIYAEQIQEWIHTNTSKCRNTVIIIDEMDKVSGPVLRGLRLALASLKQENREGTKRDGVMHKHLSEDDYGTDAVDFAVLDTNQRTASTKTLIMLLSNSGATSINGLVLDHVSNGKSRDSMTRDQFEALLLDDDVNGVDKWYGELYKAGLVDSLVPFLPLEQSHVESCVKSYMASKDKRNVPRERIQDIVQNFAYFPTDTRLFSKAGCKRVADMVTFYTE